MALLLISESGISLQNWSGINESRQLYIRFPHFLSK